MNKVPSKIYTRIKYRARFGWVCSPVDFLDLGNRAVVDQALSRMVKGGLIRRIARGLYDMPHFNPMLNAYSPPSHNQIILAISRRDGIRVVSDNIVCANALGLTNAVPAKLTYLTDGPSKIVKAGGWVIQLKHVSPGFMRNAKSKSGALFQALTWLGKDVAKTSLDLPLMLKSKMLESSDMWLGSQKKDVNFPVWMKPVIDSIAKAG